MRRSISEKDSRQLGDWSKWGKDKDNLAFFTEALRVMESKYHSGNGGLMVIGLVGSRDLPGVIVRSAQSVLRWDRRPSLWSSCFLIAKAWNGKTNLARLPIHEAPIFLRTGKFPKPEMNGLSPDSTLGLYADHHVDANVALIAVVKKGKGKAKIAGLDKEEVNAVAERAKNPNYDRLRYDLWDTLCAWQRYVWSEGEGQNPLRSGVPVCSSAYVEMAYEAMGLDLVPGASERNSAPEHIWNAAKWWYHDDAKQKAANDSPYFMTGCYVLRDQGCSLLSHDEHNPY